MNIFELFATISLKDEMSGGLDKAKGAFGKLNDAADKAVGYIIKGVAAAGTALYGLGAAAVNTGKDFEQAMANIAAVTGGTAEEIEMMGGASREMAKDFGVGATEIARAFQFIAETGGDAEEMIADMRGALALAAASGEDFKMSTELMASMMKIFGDETVDAEFIADTLAATISIANTTVGELGEALKYAGPVAGAFGYTLDDISVALAVMAENGIKGSQAGTSLRQVFTRLNEATEDNLRTVQEYIATTNERYWGNFDTVALQANALTATLGLSELQAVLGLLGITSSDSNGQMKDFSVILDGVRAATEDLSEADTAYVAKVMAGQNALSGFLALLNEQKEGLEDIREAIYSAGEAFDGIGQSLGMAEIQLDTFQGNINKLKVNLQDLGIEFFYSIEEPLREVTGKALGYVQELSEAFTEGGFAGAVSKIGDILADAVAYIAEQAPMFIQTGIDLITSLADGLSANSEAILSGAMTAFNTLMDGIRELLPKLVPLAVDVLTAFVEGFITYKELIYTTGIEVLTGLIQGIAEKLPELIPKAQEAIMNIVRGLKENLPKILKSGIDIIVQLALGIAEMLPELIPMAVDMIMTLVTELINNLPLVLDAGIKIVIGLITGLLEAIPILISKLPELITAIINFILGSTPMIIDTWIQLLVAFTEALPEIIAAIVEAIPQIITGIVDAVLGNLGPIIDAGFRFFVALIENLPVIIVEVVKAIPQIIKAIVKGFVDYIPQIIKVGGELISGLIEGFTGLAGKAVDAVKDVGGKIIGGIKGLFGIKSPSTVFADIGKNTMEGMKNGISSMSDKVKNSAASVANAAINAVSNTVSKFKEIGGNMMDGLKNGINGALNAVSNAAVSVANAAANGVKNLLGISSPSKLFAEFGGDVIDGFVQGILGAEKLVGKAMDKVFGELDQDISVGINAASGKLPGFDLTAEPVHSTGIPGFSEGVTNNFNIGELVVREEADIYKIARELAKLSARRSRGGVPVLVD